MPWCYTDITSDMYEGDVTCFHSLSWILSDLLVTGRLHQWSVLNRYVSILAIDELTREVKMKYTFMYTVCKYIILADETKEGPSRKLNIWREALGCKSYISCMKAEY